MNSLETYKILFLANLVFMVHIALVLVILFGWHFESIHTIYVLILIITLISELFLGYCLLTKLEFDLRKKLDPALNYDSSFISYYGYRLLGLNIPGKYIRYPAIIFLVVSLFIALK